MRKSSRVLGYASNLLRVLTKSLVCILVVNFLQKVLAFWTIYAFHSNKCVETVLFYNAHAQIITSGSKQLPQFSPVEEFVHENSLFQIFPYDDLTPKRKNAKTANSFPWHVRKDKFPCGPDNLIKVSTPLVHTVTPLRPRTSLQSSCSCG